MGFLDYNPESHYDPKVKRISELETELENLTMELDDDDLTQERYEVLSRELREAQNEYNRLTRRR